MDHASATPLDKAVFRAMEPLWSKTSSNPHALHKGGVAALAEVEKARAMLARALGAHSDELIFTSGGTESNNVALLGVVQAFKIKHPETKPHVIVSAIEHSSIIETAKALEKSNVDVSYLVPNEDGIVDPKELAKLLRKETILVSVMYANNEVGTIQPIKEIAKTLRHFRKTLYKEKTLLFKPEYPYLHTDAVQAVSYLETSVEKLGVDMLTLNASKIYGPKGVGLLYVKRGVQLSPIMYGGDQEKGIRPGTLPTPLIVGFAKALELTVQIRDKESLRLQKLQTYFFERLKKEIPQIQINGSVTERIPNNVHIALPHFDSELVLLELDAKGIAASAKSACKSHDPLASYVIMNVRKDLDAVTLENTAFTRFSMGRTITTKDIDYVVATLKSIVEKYSRFNS